jgi:hypothetical protein
LLLIYPSPLHHITSLASTLDIPGAGHFAVANSPSPNRRRDNSPTPFRRRFFKPNFTKFSASF